MHKGQTNVEHNLRILDKVVNVIAKRFFKFEAMQEDTPQYDEHLSMLAGKLGYLVNVTIGSTKTWNYEERIITLEKEKDNPIPYSVRKEYMFNPDIMLTIVRDNNGKIMN